MPRASLAASSIRSTAARAARRNFRKRRCSSCCGAPGCAPANRVILPPSRSRSTTSARAASSIISAAAFPATRSTSAGSRRISRKCSTTTPSSSNSWPSHTGAPASRFTGSAHARPSPGSTREMTTGEGAFSASLDADSEGEEGKFYVWSYDEVMRQLGSEDGEFFARHYDVTPEGNFEGHNILNRLEPQPRSDADEARLAALRDKLLAARGGARAPRPRRQSARRLERTDDRGARQCEPDARRTVVARYGRARLRLHRRRHDPRRSAWPFLARRPAQISRPRVGFRRDDPRRAGALRGDRSSKTISIRRSPGSTRSIATTPTRKLEPTISPPPTPRAW